MNVNTTLAPVPGKIEGIKKSSGSDFQFLLDNAGGAAALGAKKPADELEAYVKMTPAERMRDAMLKRMGVTEEELAAMPPEQRKGFEDKIGELVVEEMQQTAQKTGSRIDTSA